MANAEQRIKNLLRLTAQQQASDLHLTVARYPIIRIDGKLVPVTQEELLTPQAIQDMCDVILVKEDKKKILTEEGQVDFSYNFEDKVRFRVNAFFQQGYMSIAFRLISDKIKTLEELNMPPYFYNFTQATQGLVLLVGPTGH